MACLEKLSAMEVEREEGEIVDELDELSDISSEEEFLLRQRLQVLENYNNVLERKQAKRSFATTPIKVSANEPVIQDLSDVSLSYFDDVFQPSIKDFKVRNSTQYKHRRRKEINQENINEYFRKERRKNRTKKKIPPKVVSESSEESDQDIKSKRIKLATAISVKTKKTDSSLRSRLMNMLCSNKVNENIKLSESNNKRLEDASKQLIIRETERVINSREALNRKLTKIEKKNDKLHPVISLENSIEACKKIDFTTTVEPKNCKISENVKDFNDMDLAKKSPSHNGSDDDLEMLRNCALQSKILKTQESIKTKIGEDKAEVKLTDKNNDSANSKTILEENKEKLKQEETKLNLPSEDEDSDTSELRLICLRSTLLKKAIEMKQKQKMRKRLSQSTSLYDDIIAADLEEAAKEKDNNTDTESVDMEMGSDQEKEKGQDPSKNIIEENQNIQERKEDIVPKTDDFEEDEDLLRAKLLTSLSKNLPVLVDINNLNESIEEIETNEKANKEAKVEEKNVPQEQRFIINTADSDSEGEHEATKNLTKMHMKLSDSVEFQQKLDSFLKSARMEVESSKLPDVVQTNDGNLLNSPTKAPDKFVPKVVNHLPKTEQIEYKNLVKRMAELEKMRQARQVVINNSSRIHFPGPKDTLKPRNVTLDPNKTLPVFSNMNSNVDEQIALSRKKIAEESAKVLQLKEEGFNLSQKYKIVATELRNLSTAITLNKKSQKTAQIKLSKIRAQHQLLLKRSTTYAKPNHNVHSIKRNVERPAVKIQKENALIEKGLQSVKVSVVNDWQNKVAEDFSVQVDVSSNKKTIIVPAPKNPDKYEAVTNKDSTKKIETEFTKESRNTEREKEVFCTGSDDYESPLQALKPANWNEDINGVLCPFVVGGSCRDANCKYLHPKSFPDP